MLSTIPKKCVPSLTISRAVKSLANLSSTRKLSQIHTNPIFVLTKCQNCYQYQSQSQRNPTAIIPFVNARNYGVSRSGPSSGDDLTLFEKFKSKIGLGESSKPVLKASGHLLFIKIADEVNYSKFFEAFNMEDTFASWFYVVELHVWLVAARLMDEGKDGGVVRNSMFEAMWKDIDTRSKKLEGALASARRHQVKELGEQFQTSIIAYDEGLQSSDNVLAGALWRRFFKPVDLDSSSFLPSSMTQEAFLKQVLALELLVAYVRANYQYLHNLNRRDLVLKNKLKWTPLDESILIRQ